MRARHRTLEITGILIVVAAFTAYYLHSISVDPPETAAIARDLAMLMAFPATLWAGAVWLMVRSWWRSTGTRLSTMDLVPPQDGGVIDPSNRPSRKHC